MSRTETKICTTCGRSFSWRKRWERSWHEIRSCSQRCRRERPTELDRALEDAIVELLAGRAGVSTICPSEAARRVRPDHWRPLMERARRAARRLVAQERVEIRQGGLAVDPSTARGPIRVARGRRFTVSPSAGAD